MFFARRPRPGRSIALRLTLWYAAVFAASSALAFGLVFALAANFVAGRTDEDLREDLAEFAAFHSDGGLERVMREMVLDTPGEEARKVYLRLWGTDGRLLASSDLAAWQGLPSVPVQALSDLGTGGAAAQPSTLNLASQEHGVRTTMRSIGDGAVLEIGKSLEEDDELLAGLLRGFMLTLGLVLLCGVPIGWFMARHALRGFNEVARVAGEIAGGALERRVPVGSSGDELDRLALAFNTMLDRIHMLIVGMREMADNLAHDLKSPLARLRAGAEMCQHPGAAQAGTQVFASHAIEECDRLLEMIQITLDIAEADAGAARLKEADVDLVELALGAIDVFQTLAEDGRVALLPSLPERCVVRGDRNRLQRMLANLLDNALKYTPAGGWVKVFLRVEGAQVQLVVEDSGSGIAAADLPRVFERFYRCDTSRSQAGFGLGLSLALAFARAHGGTIIAASTPGAGSRFTVVLPQAAQTIDLRHAAQALAADALA